jgi:subtilase family serine protease
MKRSIGLLALALTVLLFGFTTPAPAQSSPAKGTVIIPESSQPHPGSISTNVEIFMPDAVEPGSYPPGENPASLACVYNLVKQTKGCPTSSTYFPSGGANAIAVTEIDANPDAASDIAAFAKAFGYPTPNLQIVCVPSGYTCHSNADTGWDLETSLDIEYSFSMAPKATIYLVEDSSDDGNAPFTAVQEAASLVAAAGGGEVSNSWIYYGEFDGETSYDKYFQENTVVFFAASGDGGAGVGYPCTSPDVVCAGGTQINRNGSGNFTSESGWSGAGGGDSIYEKRPTWQNVIKKIVKGYRGTPDISADSSTSSAVAIYCETYCGGWCEVAGTSVASPTLAGIVNAAGTFNTSSTAENTELYKEYGVTGHNYKKLFRDITTGGNGYGCKTGWDFCSGIGSDLTYKGK